MPRLASEKKLNLVWTKHIKDVEERTRFESNLRNNTLLLGRLRDILQDKLDSLDKEEVSSEDYDSPSWAFKQANRLGRKAEIKSLMDLLEFF